jgi:probable phosphoglycerate mutase
LSQLHCPATFVVVRHAEAAYEHDVLTREGGWLTAAGRTQAVQLAEQLMGRRVAAVVTSDLARAVQTAELIAGRLGIATPIEARAGLREFDIGDWVGKPRTFNLSGVVGPWAAGDLSIGCAGAETGADIVKRFGSVLDDLADRYRGETVVVVSHGTAMQLALGASAVNTTTRFTFARSVPNCGVADVECDENGLRLLTFMGEVLDPPTDPQNDWASTGA